MTGHHNADGRGDALVDHVLNERRAPVRARSGFAEQVTQSKSDPEISRSFSGNRLAVAGIVMASLVVATSAIAGVAHLVRERNRGPAADHPSCDGCGSQLATITSAGISQPSLDDAAAPTQDLRSGDTIIRVVAQPRYQGIAALDEELSIGTDSRAEYQFNSVGKILPLKDGSVIVTDAVSGARGGGSGSVRQFSATGQLLRSFGRSGDGPGEYRALGGVVALADGRVAVLDDGSQKINLYSAGGQFLDQITLDARRGLMYSGMEGIIADTSGYLYVLTPSRSARRGERSRDVPAAYIRMRPGSARIDTIVAPAFPSIPESDESRFSVDGGSVTMMHSYITRLSWTFSTLGYVVSGFPTRYAVDLLIPRTTAGTVAPATWRSGDPVLSLRRNASPVQISEIERAESRTWVTSALRYYDPTWTWSGVDVPRTKPPFSHIRTAHDGRIWVMVAQQSESSPSPPGEIKLCPTCRLQFKSPFVFDVFEPSGQYVGQVRVPNRDVAYSGAMLGDHVWGFVKDSLDVPILKRWRILWR